MWYMHSVENLDIHFHTFLTENRESKAVTWGVDFTRFHEIFFRWEWISRFYTLCIVNGPHGIYIFQTSKWDARNSYQSCDSLIQIERRWRNRSSKGFIFLSFLWHFNFKKWLVFFFNSKSQNLLYKCCNSTCFWGFLTGFKAEWVALKCQRSYRLCH